MSKRRPPSAFVGLRAVDAASGSAGARTRRLHRPLDLPGLPGLPVRIPVRLPVRGALHLSVLLPVLLAGAAGAGCGGADTSAQAEERAAPPAAVAAHFAAVREELSGERAKGIVAYVEQRWRLPGNTGFDESIHRVAALLDSAGYVLEADAAPGERLTYRIERRPMEQLTWEPVDASLTLVGMDAPLLRFATNRNMLAINSFPTPPGGVEAAVVDVGEGREEDFAGVDVRGRIAYGEASAGRLFRSAVQERGAVGVLSYGMPAYLQPEVNTASIQFTSIPYDAEARAWGLRLSYAANERLKASLAEGSVRVRVSADARSYTADELTLVADVRGAAAPEERFVFSAHVQEPGANDNASGVGAQAELARTLAALVRAGAADPARTVTFLWGDEISSTRRYLAEDSARTAGVRWGMSLDMVGEDTEVTGGTFLIEKMPDPSAIWTRGEDRHTEWGGRPLTEEDLRPHYFNDLALARCLDQAARTGWVVRTNPFEGGSDHTPFLAAGKPGLLFWHFTDRFYHTDGDRIDKVSAATLANVGTCALVTALTLASADGETARALVAEQEAAALERLAAEARLSRAAVAAGEDVAEQTRIVAVWTDYYAAALQAMEDVEVGGASPETRAAIQEAMARVQAEGARLRGEVIPPG
ncbi:MAG: M28 family peptidase [Gemmatimonadota bacterium]